MAEIHVSEVGEFTKEMMDALGEVRQNPSLIVDMWSVPKHGPIRPAQIERMARWMMLTAGESWQNRTEEQVNKWITCAHEILTIIQENTISASEMADRRFEEYSAWVWESFNRVCAGEKPLPRLQWDRPGIKLHTYGEVK